MMWGVAAIGFFSGIISGMGIGGGTILIPALLFLTEVNQQQAQGVNLIYFIPTAVVALITHRKNGTLDLKTAKPLALLGTEGIASRFTVCPIWPLWYWQGRRQEHFWRFRWNRRY